MFNIYFNPIAANMMSDEYGIDKTRPVQIVNDKHVKYLKGSSIRGCYGSSIRMKCGLSISVR